MDDSVKRSLRSVAAILFLGVLGAVLARPLFTVSDGPTGKERATRTSRDTDLIEAVPLPSPSRKAAKKSPPNDTVIYGDYPRSCLRPAAPPPEDGLVAAFRYGSAGEPHQISIGSPLGGVSATFSGMAPLQWSPSGRWLVSRGLELHDASGRPYRVFAQTGAEPWAWSPIADCLVVADGDRLVVVRPPGRKTVLVEGYGDRFWFSPEGRMLVTSVGAIDLSENPVRPVPVPSLAPTTCNIGRLKQESCAPDGRLVAAIRAGRLVLSDIETSFVRSLTTDQGWVDSFPEWGPRGTGVLFVRTPTNGDPQVWFVAEGGNPRSTGLTLPDRADLAGDDWLSYVDWSATLPAGSMPPILEE